MTDAIDNSGQPIRTTRRSRLDAFLFACRGPFERELAPLLATLFERLDDALYDLADKAGSDRLYARYFDAMRLFRKHSRNIKTIFLGELQRSAERAGNGLAEPDSALMDSLRMEDFSLVEDGDLEESLAVGNLVSKAENRYHRQLYELGRYIGDLLGARELSPRTNPLGPAAICDAFSAAIRPIQDVDLSIKLVVYKLFDKQVMDRLGGIYDQCLSLAVRNGLTPAPPPGRASTDHRLAVSPPPRHAQTPRAGQMPHGTPPRVPGQVSFDELRSLLDQWRGTPRQARGGPVATGVVHTGELVALLSELQGRPLPARPDRLTPQNLLVRIEGALRTEQHQRGGQGRSLGEIDEDTLELVSLLFDSIVQGADLPDPIKALVARLQIPLVKVALLDRTFFDDQDHPARRLLNRIADATVGWSEEDERTPNSLYGRIEQIVGRVIGGFDRDMHIFHELDAELAAYLAENAVRTRTVEVQVCYQAAGRDRIASAQERAQAVIDDRLRQAPPVPPVIATMLNEGWRKVLQAAYLSGGKNSREWLNAVDTVDLLVWSIQPQVTGEDRRTLLRRIPELLRGLRTGLSAIDFDQRVLALWFKELQALHLTALRRTGSEEERGPATPTDTQAALGVAEDRASGHAVGRTGAWGPSGPGPAATPGANRELATRVQRLVPGSWIELMHDARRVRLKLVWVSSNGQRMQFVDGHGREGPEVASDDLVTLIAYGLARVIRGKDDPPLVDRAVAALTRNLSH